MNANKYSVKEIGCYKRLSDYSKYLYEEESERTRHLNNTMKAQENRDHGQIFILWVPAFMSA